MSQSAPITAGSLIELLKQVSPDTIIVLSKDEEGNSYRQPYAVSTDYNYDAESREVGLRQLTKEDLKKGYTDEDVMTNGKPCVCLW